MSRRPSPLQMHDAVTRVRQGATLDEVARGLGVHRATLGKAVRSAALAAGEPVRKGRTLPKRIAPAYTGDLDWMDSGNCVAWPDFTEMDVEPRKRICWDGCPVRDQCREFGLAGIEAGMSTQQVYGGLSPRDLMRLYRLRREEAAKAQRLRAEVAS